ncbi:MAG: SDR family oxidoreductase [Alphaproteobacteria bacterium]|nr:SDR family oxidoreductase [Alphaproteobacteria bacterium]
MTEPKFKRGERVKDKIVLVTGAGSIGPGWGNGKAAAVLYGREGGRVFCVDRALAAAEETMAIIEREGGIAAAHAADVMKSADVKAMVDACIARFGRVDILHNNVGGSGPGNTLADTEEDDWDAVMARNVKSAYMCCRAVLPHMEKQGGGAIVNVSSIVGIRHAGFHTMAYSASKGALNQFTQNIAVQLAPKNIRANCVAPGLIDTPFIHREINGVPGYKRRGFSSVDEYRHSRDHAIPAGRSGTGWDIAFASLFLASDEASYVTGQLLTVDGGLTSSVGKID